MKYIPHYDQNTAIRHGTPPTANELSARTAGLKEKGMIRSGETLLPNKGYVPIFEGPVLTKEEQNLLCLIVLDEPEAPRSLSPAPDNAADLVKEYKAEFRRVNGHDIDVQLEGTQILINGDVVKRSLVERFLATLKARNP